MVTATFTTAFCVSFVAVLPSMSTLSMKARVPAFSTMDDRASERPEWIASELFCEEKMPAVSTV